MMPENMAHKMSKTIGKKIAKLKLFLMNYQRKSEKSTKLDSSEKKPKRDFGDSRDILYYFSKRIGF